MTARDSGEFSDGVLYPRGCFTIYDAHVGDRSVIFQSLIQSSRIDRLVLDQRAQRRDDLEILARLYLQENVGVPGAGSFTNINEHHGPTLAALGYVLALGNQGVPGEMQGMTISRVPSPVDDEIRPVLDLTQGARDLAAQLGGHLGGTVSQRGVAVDHASNPLGQGDRVALRLAGGIAQPVHQRHIRLVQVLGRRLHRLIKRGCLAIDQGVRIAMLRRMILEPGLPESAGALRLDDSITLGLQADVVAHATAEGTGGVLNRFLGHGFLT